MRARERARVRFGVPPVRKWPLWALPRWLVTYIIVVVAADAAAIGAAAAVGFGDWRDLLLFGVLVLCTAATVELMRRVGENAGLIKDVYAVWELPVAILLPLVYALIIPIVRFGLTQVRVRQVPLHRRVFSAAVIGLSYASASLAFHALSGAHLGLMTLPPGKAVLWLLAIAAAGVLYVGVHIMLLFTAIKGADPSVRIRDLYLTRESVQNDVAELSVAVVVTLAIAVTPLTIAFAFPFVTLLQRSFRHAHLIAASRLDSKTGLLNAGTWEREAASEVARAIRTRTPLAVALIDLDHFKAVNDAHGHLIGDKALNAVAQTLIGFVRDYDLVGRFGGEEFALLLPQTRAVDAYSIAERMRSYIASTPIAASGTDGQPIKVTVSIGVAAVGASWDIAAGSQLTDLLAAADSALYQAKKNGRDQVCVITENATFGGLRAGQPQLAHQQPPGGPTDLDPREQTSLPSVLLGEVSPAPCDGPADG